MSKPLVEFALDYARRGWNVFPCKPSNKAPYTGSGLNAATTDPDIIRDWWQHWPHAMIGVRMGQASGVWALDPDMPDKPGAADGLASWRGLVATRGGCPPTHSHLTPRGGLHLLFKWRDDRPITNSEGQLWPRKRAAGVWIIAAQRGLLYPINGHQSGCRSYRTARLVRLSIQRGSLQPFHAPSRRS